MSLLSLTKFPFIIGCFAGIKIKQEDEDEGPALRRSSRRSTYESSSVPSAPKAKTPIKKEKEVHKAERIALTQHDSTRDQNMDQ
jgi:hypothetical protein